MTSRDSSERDQLWASLRTLRPKLVALLQEEPPYSDRDTQLVQLLARIVLAELDYRAESTADD